MYFILKNFNLKDIVWNKYKYEAKKQLSTEQNCQHNCLNIQDKEHAKTKSNGLFKFWKAFDQKNCH